MGSPHITRVLIIIIILCEILNQLVHSGMSTVMEVIEDANNLKQEISASLSEAKTTKDSISKKLSDILIMAKDKDKLQEAVT